MYDNASAKRLYTGEWNDGDRWRALTRGKDTAGVFATLRPYACRENLNETASVKFTESGRMRRNGKINCSRPFSESCKPVDDENIFEAALSSDFDAQGRKGEGC